MQWTIPLTEVNLLGTNKKISTTARVLVRVHSLAFEIMVVEVANEREHSLFAGNFSLKCNCLSLLQTNVL